jgi:anti-anti-sigma factor
MLGTLDVGGPDSRRAGQGSGEEREMLVQRMAGRSSVVRCAEPLDATASERLRALVAGPVQTARRVILDLSAAAYADSAGLRELLHLQQRLRTQGAELRLVVPPGSRIDRALRLVGFASLLALYPSGRLAWRERGRLRPAAPRQRAIA